MLFDTHIHLQFQAFKGKVDQVIKESLEAGIEKMVVVGTNVETSIKAVDLAQKYDCLYAAVGIHPHHIYEYLTSHSGGRRPIESNQKDAIASLQHDLEKIQDLLKEEKVIAVGETGIDKHHYLKTKHPEYEVNDNFITLQKKAFEAQIKLAITSQKSLIIHNREAVKETLDVLETNWGKSLERKAVFHCAEPDQRLLDFAKEHHVFIGIDGDVTYDKAKQEFIKKIPLRLLVLETDSPFLGPQGFNFPNTPKSLKVILEFISEILKMDKEKLAEITFNNSEKLFIFE